MWRIVIPALFGRAGWFPRSRTSTGRRGPLESTCASPSVPLHGAVNWRALRLPAAVVQTHIKGADRVV